MLIFVKNYTKLVFDTSDIPFFYSKVNCKSTEQILILAEKNIDFVLCLGFINKTESKFSPRPRANPFCNLFKSIQLLPVL